MQNYSWGYEEYNPSDDAWDSGIHDLWQEQLNEIILHEEKLRKKEEVMKNYEFLMFLNNDYQLVYNRENTRKILEIAFKYSKNRLIIVCPWLCLSGFNQSVFNYLDEYLREYRSKNSIFEIGFGSLNDFSKNTDFSKLTIDYIINYFKNKQDSWKYNALEEIYSIAQTYSSRIKLHFLGTHEKYIICDEQFAFITSHNLLTSDETNNQKEIGMFIRDKNIIKELTSHFDLSLKSLKNPTEK